MNDQIKLELIGPNHTLAYLIYSGRYHHSNGHSDDIQSISKSKSLYAEQKNFSLDLSSQRGDDVLKNHPLADISLQAILQSFYQILKEYPMGDESTNLVQLVS